MITMNRPDPLQCNREDFPVSEDASRHLSPEYIVLDCSFVSGLDGNAVDGFLKLQVRFEMDSLTSSFHYMWHSALHSELLMSCHACVNYSILIETLRGARSFPTPRTHHFCWSSAIPSENV